MEKLVQMPGLRFLKNCDGREGGKEERRGGEEN